MTLGEFKSKDDSGGVRVCISEEAKCYLFVRRASNKDYQGALNTLMKQNVKVAPVPEENGNQYANRGKDDLMTQALSSILDAVGPEERQRLTARYILVGWENLTDDFGDFPDHCEEGDSKRIRYTPEAALALLTHERYQGFYELVMQIAQDQALFREQRVGADAGNLSGASGGGSKTQKE